jgi:HEAT repeat protein
MKLESIPQQIIQPTLFDYGDAASGAVELFPAVWAAAEALSSPDLMVRQHGLTRLVELGAPRLSPLIASLLVNHLTEPDLEIRRQIAYVLGDILATNEAGCQTPELVRQYLVYALGQMRQRPIFALLEISIGDPLAETVIYRLLNACPYAGRHLADILTERRMPLVVRRMAIHYIGLVGYLDAMPALERMLLRLESRTAGQQSMPFAPPVQSDEWHLLPEIRSALANLSAP